MVAPEGMEAADAEVSWSRLDNDVVGHWATRDATLDLFFSATRTERIHLSTVRSRPDAEGRVRLERPEEFGTDDTVLWITHPGALPIGKKLAADGTDWPMGERLSLAACAPSYLKVVDSRGQVVEGATIQRQALPKLDFEVPLDNVMDVAVRALARSSHSDADGMAAVVPFGLPQEIVVQSGALAARWLRDTDPNGETITLGPWATLSGVVRSAGPLGPWPTVAVDGLGVGDAELGRVTAADVRSDGRFGPVLVPLAEDLVALRVWLQNSDSFAETRVERPVAGTNVQVELDAALGVAFYLQAMDAATGDDVVDVTVRLLRAAGGPAWDRRAVGNGYVHLTGVPEGSYLVEGTAAGYARTRVPIYVQKALEGVAVSFDMHRPARLSGVVLDGEAPVQRFRLSLATVGESSAPRLVEVRGATLGRYEIDDLAPGEYQVHALALGQRVTAVETVEVVSGEHARLDLKLLELAQIVGRVRDGETGEGVGEATIDVALSNGETLAEALYVGLPTDAQGQFALADIPVRGAHLIFRAPGRRVRQMDLPSLTAGTAHDVGEVLLVPAAAQRYRLVGVKSGAFDGYRMQTPGATSFQSLDAHGECLATRTLESRFVVVRHPDGTFDHFQLLESLFGTDVIELPVVPGTVRVQVSGEDDRAHVLEIRWEDPDVGWGARSLLLKERSFFELPGVPARAAHFAVHDEDGIALAAEAVWLDEAGAADVQLTLGAVGVTLRVVDAAGTAVPGASIHLQDFSQVGALAYPRAETNADGEAELFGLRAASLFLWLTHPDGSRVIQRSIVLPPPGESLDVVLNADRELLLQVVIDGAPAPLADVVLRGPRGISQFANGLTDGEGRFRSARIASEPVLVEVRRAGAWPFSEVLDPPQQGVATAIELRPLGSLRLRVVDGEGVPVVGAGVVLEHLGVRQHDALRGALGGHVGAWMGAGWLAQQSLVSDALGRVVLEGLPHGDYRVRVDSHAGRGAGAARVGAGAGEAVLVVVP